MKAEHYDILGLLVSSANGWHSDGVTVGVKISEVRTTFPDGSLVTLTWVDDENGGQWNVSSF